MKAAMVARGLQVRHGMPDLCEYLVPTSLEEAHRVLISAEGSKPVAGATSYKLFAHPGVRVLVDLSRSGLDYIRAQGGEILIGAMTRCEDLRRSPIFEHPALRVIKHAARTVGPVRLRNHVTAGGNIARVFPWSNLPVALLALEARVKIVGSGTRSIDAADFFGRDPSRMLSRGEIVAEIAVPDHRSNGSDVVSGWTRLSYTQSDMPILNLACVVFSDGPRVAHLNIVVGGSTRLPTRLRRVENSLKDRLVRGLFDGRGRLVAAAEEALGEDLDSLKLVNTVKVGKEYQRTVMRPLVRRVIKESLSR